MSKHCYFLAVLHSKIQNKLKMLTSTVSKHNTVSLNLAFFVALAAKKKVQAEKTSKM
jgi:hypothetical protein